MVSPNETRHPPAQPPLAGLLATFFQRQAHAHASGLVLPEPTREVEPFDAAPEDPPDPVVAWKHALAAARFLTSSPAAGLSFSSPPDWPQLVAAQRPTAALAFCLGNYPQLFRELQPLLQGQPLGSFRPSRETTAAPPPLARWAEQTAGKQTYPWPLLGAAVLRLAGDHDAARHLLEEQRAAVPAAWRDAWGNEQASLAWHAGRTDEAIALWHALPDGPAVRFNRGMASLFTDHPDRARLWLRQAVADLPEDEAWHHLGRLYLTLAELRL